MSNDQHGTATAHHGGHAPTRVDSVLFVAFTILVGLIVQIVWQDSKFLKKYLPLPFTVIIFVIGLGWGYCTPKYGNGGSLDDAISPAMIEIDPHLFLQLFIPPLLFESGWAMNVHMFQKTAFSCLFLASVGVVFAMLISAMLCYYVYPDDWSWNTCLIFGAMAAATDPVAVGAVLKELGAPETLATVIEGESLLNDGSSFVFFSLFLKKVTETQSAGDVAETLAQMALGGAAFGLAMGVAGSLCLRLNYTRHSYFTVVILTVVMPYLTFWVAENPLGLSGVLATVVMAITMNKYGKLYVRHKHELHEFWEHLAFIANTIVFMIAGGIIGDSLEKRKFHDFGYQFVNYLFMNLIRFVFLFGSVPLLSRMGYGFSWPEASIATWGGLRGAVGLSMAIMVYHNEGLSQVHRDELFDYNASLVLLTLCVNGTSSGALLRYLGYDRKSDVSVTMAKSARIKLIDNAGKLIQELSQQPAESNLPAADADDMKKNIALLDDATKARFDAIPVVASEFIDSGQVREQMLQAVESNLQHASEEGLVSREALFYIKDSCDMLLDPRYTTGAHTETHLKNWWFELLEPTAEGKMQPLWPAAEKMPLIGNFMRHWTLYQQSIGIDIALAFIQLTAKVTDQYAHKKALSAERTDLNQDGKISREEYKAMYGTLDGFDAIDLDNDGYIDATELMKVDKNRMSASMMDDAIDLEDTTLLGELKSAAENATSWLGHQPRHIVAMVQTKHGTEKLLRRLWQMTEEKTHTGAIGSMEANIILEEIQHLESQNASITNLQKITDAFLAHVPQGETTATVHTPNGLAMGTNPNLDEELSHDTTGSAPAPDKFAVVVS